VSDEMRKQFEKSTRFKGMDFTRSITHPEYYESPYANGAWDGWKASRDAAFPDWQAMSTEPPFPFTGDICVSGRVILGAAWCAGYWQTPGRSVDRERVSHWKFPNPEILPPESLR